MSKHDSNGWPDSCEPTSNPPGIELREMAPTGEIRPGDLSFQRRQKEGAGWGRWRGELGPGSLIALVLLAVPPMFSQLPTKAPNQFSINTNELNQQLTEDGSEQVLAIAQKELI